MIPTDDAVSCLVCGSESLRSICSDEKASLLRCRSCGLGFVWPPPAPIAVAEYFGAASVASQEASARKFERNRDRVLSRVARYIQRKKSGGKILDLGCAYGYFLSQYFRLPQWESWGSDLSRDCAAKAAEKGIRIHCGPLKAADFAPASFDVVTILDALYYFPDPRAELREIHRILKPDGLLLIELPSASNRIWRTTTRLGRALGGSGRTLLQSSDHLVYYSPDAATFLLRQCQFSVSEIVPLPSNRQQSWSASLVYGTHSVVSSVLWRISWARVVAAIPVMTNTPLKFTAPL
jgi:SAM-dependent methyltransferase